VRKAQANYYARRFGVELDPNTEVVMTMGSKEGLASMATAMTAPGDVVLAPNPSYPIHTFGFIIAGATIRSVPTTPDEAYWRALDRAMAFTVPRPSVLIVNYPSNPTAETVDLAFYERLVAWAKENKVWVLSDLAYSELYYDGNPTPSILQVPGAKEVAVEFTSMSKTFSMAGWRVGFAVGQQATDRSAHPGEELSRLWSLHADPGRDLRGAERTAGHRREKPRTLPKTPRRPGRELRPRRLGDPAPRASMFAWAPLPSALKDMGSLEFSKQLLTHAEVAVAPGVGYGEDGEGFVRIAMVENEQRLRQAARNIKRYLSSMGVNSSAA
jgi:alanine-synthesizing transaminase